MNQEKPIISFFNQVWKDPVVWLFVGLYIAFHWPFFWPGFSYDQLSVYSWLVASLFLLPFAIYVLWPQLRESMTDNERWFWRAISIGFSLWWLISVVNWLSLVDSFPLYDLWGTALDVATDFIFLGFYICWLIALSYAPHTSYVQDTERKDRRLLAIGATVTAFSLFLYFILVPSRITPELFETWIPSLLFFASLDFVVAIMLALFMIRATNNRWKMLYCIMMVNGFLFVGLDLLEATDYSDRFNWASSPKLDMIWTIPYFLIVLSARGRRYQFSAGANEPTQPPPPIRRHPIFSISPIILASFILPVLHIGFDNFGLVRPELRQLQGSVVLASLIIIWSLAFFENRSLRIAYRKASQQAADLEQLRIKQEIAQKSEQAKARFLANVSHEIRTPMNGILGMSELLLQGDLDQDQGDQAQLVKSSAQGLLAVIDDILEYSKFESGQITVSEQPFRLNEVAGNVADLFRMSGRQKNIDLHLEISEDIPPMLVGDSSRLRQVLMNLVSNAVKFTHSGEIGISFDLRRQDNSDVLVRCEVRDTGIGIDPDRVEELFLPFSQGDESTSREYGGSGLGLAITKQIIEAQSGTIGVASQPGGGSTFWFEIPYQVATNEQSTQSEEKGKLPESFSELRVLVAEDDMVSQVVAAKQLEALGVEADVVNNGHEVLKALERRQYSLILMDCQMPSLDGFQATSRVREMGYSQTDLPIIALTAHVLEEDKQNCYEAGMNDVLSKPILIEGLRDALTRWTNAEPGPA